MIRKFDESYHITQTTNSSERNADPKSFGDSK